MQAPPLLAWWAMPLPTLRLLLSWFLWNREYPATEFPSQTGSPAIWNNGNPATRTNKHNETTHVKRNWHQIIWPAYVNWRCNHEGLMQNDWTVAHHKQSVDVAVKSHWAMSATTKSSDNALINYVNCFGLEWIEQGSQHNVCKLIWSLLLQLKTFPSGRMKMHT